MNLPGVATRGVVKAPTQQAARNKSSSPGIKEIGAYLDRKARANILDLGPAIAANIEFFANWSPRIRIEDLYGSIKLLGDYGRTVEPTLCPVFTNLMSCNPGTRFDVILAWDLFDYMPSADIESLIAYIDRFTQSGTLLFALVSIQPRIPEQPARFRVLDAEHLCWEYITDSTVSCRRFTQTALLKLLPNFRLRRSFLMRSGFQEYLLERR